MAEKRIRAKSFFFAQYINPDYWQTKEKYSQEEFEQQFADLSTVGSRFNKAFEVNGQKVEKLAIINHDQDVRSDGSKKPQHVHIFLEFSKRVDANVVAKVLGIAPNYVVPVKKGRYGKENALAYMTHAKQPDKYQYNANEVYCDNSKPSDTFPVTYADGWYQQYYAEHEEAWAAYRATYKRKKKDLTLDLVEQRILEGKYATLDQLMMDNDAYTLYIKHKQEIQNTFETATRRKALLFAKQLADGTAKKKVVFITGIPGAGKTKFAGQLIKALQIVHPGWNAFFGGGKDAWDKYCGQEIAVLDDMRVNDMKGGAVSWLHVMDPYYNTADLSARYNDNPPAFKILIITNYQDPVTFFSYLKENENIDQFLRRISYTVTILNAKNGTKTSLTTDNTKLSSASAAFEFEKKMLPESLNHSEGDGAIISDYRSLNQKATYLVGSGNYKYQQEVSWIPVPFAAEKVNKAVDLVSKLLTGSITKEELLATYEKINAISPEMQRKLIESSNSSTKKDAASDDTTSNVKDDDLPFDL